MLLYCNEISTRSFSSLNVNQSQSLGIIWFCVLLALLSLVLLSSIELLRNWKLFRLEKRRRRKKKPLRYCVTIYTHTHTVRCSMFSFRCLQYHCCCVSDFQKLIINTSAYLKWGFFRQEYWRRRGEREREKNKMKNWKQRIFRSH